MLYLPLVCVQGAFDYDIDALDVVDPYSSVYISVSPVTVWQLTLPEDANVAVDLSGVTEISLQFSGVAKPLTGDAKCLPGEERGKTDEQALAACPEGRRGVVDTSPACCQVVQKAVNGCVCWTAHSHAQVCPPFHASRMMLHLAP